MASAAAAAAAALAASPSALLLQNRSARASIRATHGRVLLPGLGPVTIVSPQRKRVVVAADNVEQQQTEQKEQGVMQEALQETMSNLETLKEAKSKSILSSREGLEEKFAVLNTGAYECRSCGHVYEEAKGDASYPVAAGTYFRDLPEDWLCPTCGAAKSYYQPKSVEVAGFAQNQQFGLGGNTLTSGQKSLLIYGSLLAFFALFLSGYFLQ
ncbi:uncharacterized protein [Physcomitrium patens]|uniref:Rubredoxin-like domain-containing protein n=1 Tax=Physcomitrium patens TaxID=3218 RepID=A0A2K1L961_PHYPA|nr:uncharacterized protein LOC112272670 [Physcomitrium patens]PNR62579.1 hypothetical protein PHYPA_001003 [Physcomitrium patens]|eukprot:XP_024356462.1 uncharacterized protein LOC112272670 [Physcomitrella patens]